jgi:hypothetical protein
MTPLLADPRSTPRAAPSTVDGVGTQSPETLDRSDMEAADSQARLARARSANRPGSRVPQYRGGAPVVQRELVAAGALRVAHPCPRAPATADHVDAPTSAGVGDHLRDRPTSHGASARVVPVLRAGGSPSRHAVPDRIVEVPDPTPRSITAKLLDRPDLIARIQTLTSGRLAYI